MRKGWAAGTRSRAVRLAGLAVLIGLLAAAETWRSYQQATTAGERQVAGIVGLLAEQTERTIQAIDFTLIGIRDALRVAPNLAPGDAAFRSTMTHRLKRLPYVRTLYVVGPDGFVLHSTSDAHLEGASFAERPYFQVHRLEPETGLHIGQPLRSLKGGIWFVSFSRRIANADGSFAGVVVAAVEPKYFKHFYEEISMRGDDLVALLLRDGTLIARTPNHDETIGQSYSESPLRHLAMTNGGGIAWNASTLDGVQRVVGYRVLARGAAIVLFGLAASTIYDAWLEHTAVVGGAAVLVWSLASGLMLLRIKHQRRDRLAQVRAGQAQRLETMGRIAGGIAHDLGNTIKIARTTFSLLRPSLASESEALQLVDEADRSLKSAFDIIDRLLAFARRQELNPRATDLAELIGGFVPILRQAAGPRVELTLDIVKPLVSLIDPIHLESALLNLVLNSRDAMPDGGRIVIEVREVPAPAGRALRRTRLRPKAPDRPWAEIVVRDDGVGMSPDVRQQAFEPFFTTRNGGSGLGLSQVLGFVQQSAGDIRIESRPGGGTAVRLQFPTAPADTPPPSAAT
jgi:signal transduction histidine kinase